MSRRLAAGLAATALLGAGVALGLWRFTTTRPETALEPIPVSPAPQPRPPPRATIIDLPGDPALVARAAQKAPRRISLAAPARLAPEAPKPETEAFYVGEPLTPATGGSLEKFAGNGLEADALNAELQTDASGGDDDGGDMTPDNVEIAPLSGANSQRIEAVAGGDNGRPQLKEAILRPAAAEKISQLLIESGYEEASAADVEATAKRLYNIQSLPIGAVALAVGALDAYGAYRVMQFSMFEDREYIGTVALAASGAYGEGAEPTLPQGLLDTTGAPSPGERFNLADGVYSAGLRSAVPEPVIREAVHLIGGLIDLSAPLASGETLKLIYAAQPRAKTQAASRVVYVGLEGPSSAECYAFELKDGSYRCFVKDEPAENGVPLPPVDTGAAAVGGLLAPIRGAPITSLFGMRFHPILHITRLHAGIDFGAAVGSQVRAAADGVVESAGEARGYGQRVVLKHGGYETTYNHLSEIRVAPGESVKQGEVVALSGNSGLSTGPHLHFEYRINGVPVDPLPHLGREVPGSLVASAARQDAPARPADPATLAAFAAAKAGIDAALVEAAR
jgi:murein DD-endopeptidase MepM/ murein hydrolase activator NlpD